MKVLPFKIPKPNDDALIYQEDHEYVFYDKYHQHEEIQLSYIARGSGTLIVADSINGYKEGDILVLGSELPHVFKSEPSDARSLMLSFFFTENSFGTNFFELEEMKAVRPFFKRAMKGFKISSHEYHSAFLALKKQNKLERFLCLIKLLKALSISECIQLSSFVYQKQYSDNEGKRMSDVMEFTMNNYKCQITLDEVASVANLTKNAFCKYFKKRTNKSYFSFLNELRLENACKLLAANNEILIVEIAEQCGFQNISNFNRQFKKLKKSTSSYL